MIVTFCGHAQYQGTQEDETKILTLLEKRIGDTPVEFFLGEHGNFDRFAYHCARVFRERHPLAKLIHVTPYLQARSSTQYDQTLYPPLETVPPRYAIAHRNRWMADRADWMIAYVTHEYGGAYAMYRYAKGKGKEIYNLASSGP